MSECKGCAPVIICNQPPDIAPSKGFEATQPFIITVDCPVGYVCFEGTFPQIITVKPPPVTIDPGATQIILQSCSETIVAEIPAGATADQIAAIAASVQAKWAADEALCIAITKTFPPPKPRPIALPNACYKTDYTQQLKDSTGFQTVVFQDGALPEGMEIQGTGPLYLTGRPTQPGSFGFTLRYVGLAQVTTRSYTVNVNKITFTPAGANDETLPDATKGTAYTETFVAPPFAAAPLSWQVIDGVLPPGLTLNESTGEITGTPTEEGTWTFTILLQERAS